MSEDLPALPPTSLWMRTVGAIALFTRATLAQMGVGTRPPGRPGASSGLVAGRPEAQDHLRQMSESPALYAGLGRRGRSLGNYEFVVLRDGKVVTGAQEPWVYDLTALLQTPDPEDGVSQDDTEHLCPVEPGEHLIGQLVVDYLQAGVAYAIPTAGDDGRIAGLTRAHPGTMKLVKGGTAWHHTLNGQVREYPRRAVFCIRNLSWEQTGQGELGTGAGAVLSPVVDAERTAMEKTAQLIDQGGADIIVSSTSPQGLAFLANPQNRDAVKKDMTAALALRDGSRVVVISGDLTAKPSGFAPAEIQAPDLLEAARTAELMAIGVTPVAVGLGDANYATAALQLRVQADLDEQLASVFEAFLLRPLAWHYARMSGKSYRDSRRYTCRIDLSTHPGYAYARTEAIDRMDKLVNMGWSAEQAAAIEGQPFPKPAGQPRPRATSTGGTAGNEPPPVGRAASPSVPPASARESSQEGDLPEVDRGR